MSFSFQSLSRRIVSLLALGKYLRYFFILASCFLVTTTPRFAKSITGSKISDIGKEPNFLCAAKTPATVPGIPTAIAPKVLFPLITSPFSSRYMSLCAANGAFSL